MNAPKTLRPPENWQDFESLCKKLWGEIWQCPEIQKNGRLGQDQSGVDVFGTPYNDPDNYYGIQCKGKNEYSNSKFTEDEILKEIAKAMEFKPPLKKYYLATTAQNDSKIQEFVRIKNIEHKSKGLFEIHLFAWESIVDLIDENKQTHDYYLKSQNYKTSKSVLVTLHNLENEFIANPKFKQQVTIYGQNDPMESLFNNPALRQLAKVDRLVNIMNHSGMSSNKINLSYIFTEIRITNTGSEPIEDYKILLDFEGEIIELAKTNEVRDYIAIIPSNRYRNTSLCSNSKTGCIVPASNILVGDDKFVSDDIYIKPKAIEQDLKIKWRLISKDFKDDGELIIKVIPEIVTRRKFITIDNETDARTETQEAEDYLEQKKD